MAKWKNKSNFSFLLRSSLDNGFSGIDLTDDMLYSDSNANRELKIVKETEDLFIHQLIKTDKDFSVTKPKPGRQMQSPGDKRMERVFGHSDFPFFFTGYLDDVLRKQEIAAMEIGLMCICCGTMIEGHVAPWDLVLHPELGTLCPACNEHLEISVGRHCDADGARYDWLTNSFTKDKEYDTVNTTAEAIMSRSNNYIIQLSATYKPKDRTTRYNPSWWVDM